MWKLETLGTILLKKLENDLLNELKCCKKCLAIHKKETAVLHRGCGKSDSGNPASIQCWSQWLDKPCQCTVKPV